MVTTWGCKMGQKSKKQTYNKILKKKLKDKTKKNSGRNFNRVQGNFYKVTSAVRNGRVYQQNQKRKVEFSAASVKGKSIQWQQNDIDQWKQQCGVCI